MENNLKNKWYYIVYETTNLINNKIYIGIHKTKDPYKFDGYLGCGVINTQPYTYQHAKTAFQFAVKKHGPKNFVRKTLAVFDTEQQALDLEERLVNEEFLSRDDVYNMILGGGGGIFISGRIKVFQYDLEGNYLREFKSFADAGLHVGSIYHHISDAAKNKHRASNYFWSTDKIDKLDISLYDLKDNHKKPIFCYLKTGEFYQGFESQSQCVKELDVAAYHIKNACLLGICIRNRYYFSYIEADNYDKARTKYIKIREVHKYDGNSGKYISSYESQEKAEKENIGSNISNSIKLKTPDKNNFLWSIDKMSDYNSPKIVNEKRAVGKYDLDGNLITHYESATAAAKENGTSVWKVLSKLTKTHKKHIYQYL